MVHIYRSWDWIVAALSRIFTHQTATTRFSLILNILVFVATTREVVGGLLPTLLKLGALGVATVQVGNLAKRLRRIRPPAQHAA